MKTILNQPILPTTRGLIYFCDYIDGKLIPLVCIQYMSPEMALLEYISIENKASQIAMGDTVEQFMEDLTSLHSFIQDEEWQRELGYYIND